jgi:hypothetical protein
VDISKLWDFFDKASQNNNKVCEGGSLLFLSKKHFFKLKMGLGLGSNNYVELLSLKILLLFTREKYAKTI